jgi:hypothetical protein
MKNKKLILPQVLLLSISLLSSCIEQDNAKKVKNTSSTDEIAKEPTKTLPIPANPVTPANPVIPPVVAVPTTPAPVVPTPTTPTPTPPAYNPTIVLGAVITDIKLESTSTIAQTKVPFTLGHAFIKGNLLPNEGIAGKLANGTVIPLQINVKALHTDGSVRHAIISGVMPTLNANAIETIQLTKATLTKSTAATVTALDLLNEYITASINIKISGVDYQINLEEVLKGSSPQPWLQGPIVNEFVMGAPFKKVSDGSLHPHMTARFAVRSFSGLGRAKIDVTLENAKIYEPNPSDFTYDIQINVGGQQVYTKAALVHHRNTRWHKNFWTSAEPKVHIKHNTAYLINTKAVPNYDQRIQISEAGLASIKTRLDASNTAPMGTGLANSYMPSTGGRPDIGIIPAWGALTILSMDKRAKEATLVMGDVAGSWGTHYRDTVTDMPASIVDYPYMSGNVNPAFNKAANRNEYLLKCTGPCTNPNTADTSHQPAFSYLPYLLTGEYYYMEELMFYGMWNVGSGNYAYREHDKGLVKSDQVRGMGWTIRTLTDNAYILPEGNRLKPHFHHFLKSNFEWFNTNYTNGPSNNVFGAIAHGYAIVYSDGKGVGPWQDDFLTQAVGRAAEREIPGAAEFMQFKGKFPVGRMVAPGTCWIAASSYTLIVRPLNTSPLYTSFAEAYLATNAPEITNAACGSQEMATAMGTAKAGSMMGYPTGSMGYGANMQPALAMAVDAKVPNAQKAWDLYEQRPVKQIYTSEPQFAIVPR